MSILVGVWCVQSEIKVAADCKWSGAGERKTVVKTSPPAAARPATPRRDNADASERKKVLRSPDSGARSGPRPGGRAALNGGGDGPKIKRRPRQDGDGVGSPVGKRVRVRATEVSGVRLYALGELG